MLSKPPVHSKVLLRDCEIFGEISFEALPRCRGLGQLGLGEPGLVAGRALLLLGLLPALGSPVLEPNLQQCWLNDLFRIPEQRFSYF